MAKKELQPRGAEPNVVELACEYLGFVDDEGLSMQSPCCLEDGYDFA